MENLENEVVLSVLPAPEEEILHLKQLLVTLKQQHEKELDSLRESIAIEEKQSRKLNFQLTVAQADMARMKRMHEEELNSLKQALLNEEEQRRKLDMQLTAVQAEMQKILGGHENEIKELQEMHRAQVALVEEVLSKAQDDHQFKLKELEHLMGQIQIRHESEMGALQEKQLAELILMEEENNAKVSVQDLKFQELESLLELQEKTLKERADLYLNLAEEKDRLEDQLIEFKEMLEENETRLNASQQHLAKKVKEAAHLSEKVDSTALQLEEADRKIFLLSSQVKDMQADMDGQQQKEERLQEQMHETLKEVEQQAAQWEKKYLEMQTKWQASENQIAQFKKMEEKHLEMQNLLMSLGNYMGEKVQEKTLPGKKACVSLEEAPLAKSKIEHHPFGMHFEHSRFYE